MVASSGSSSAPIDELLRVVPRLVDRTARQVEFSRVLLGRVPCVGERMVSLGVALRREDAFDRPGALPTPSTAARNGDEPGTDGPPPQVRDAGERKDTKAARRPGAAEPAGDHPDQDDLAIPEYDSLAASQVIPRLEMLKPTDLRQILRYEESNRNRQTIVHKVGQLLAEATNQ